MRKVISNINSIVGKAIVSRVSNLIISAEALRSLCADLRLALRYSASRFAIETYDAGWQMPVEVRGLKPCVHAASCLALVKQRQWGHEMTCHHAVA